MSLQNSTNYSDMIFRRGYIITENDQQLHIPENLKCWDTTVLSEFTVLSHPHLPTNVYKDDYHNFLLLGNAIDPINGNRRISPILKNLSEQLFKSRDNFYDHLDHLTGRFVLLVESDSDTSFVVQDAAGTKALFYDIARSDCLITSHPEIIAQINGYEKSKLAEEVIQSNEAYFPGLSTPYASVRRLTPNTLFTIPEGEVKRFFPRESYTPVQSPDETVKEIADILTTQMRLWNESNDLFLSLSAGLDSRLSLAATRDISNDVKYYSWIFPGKNHGEANIAAKLCQYLGLNHQTIDLLDKAPPDFVDMFMENTSHMSDPARAHGIYNFQNKLPAGEIELRSNVAEVGRTFYRKSIMKPPMKIDPRYLTKIYYRVNSDRVLDEFEKFIKITSFEDEEIHGYDIYDLFYWEFRMGSWLSTWMMDKDLSHENFIVYNNRTLLKKMLSIDIDQRKSDNLFLNIIDELWPECLDIPINPHKNKQSNIGKNAERLGYGLALRVPLPLYRKIIKRYQNF